MQIREMRCTVSVSGLVISLFSAFSLVRVLIGNRFVFIFCVVLCLSKSEVCYVCDLVLGSNFFFSHRSALWF